MSDSSPDPVVEPAPPPREPRVSAARKAVARGHRKRKPAAKSAAKKVAARRESKPKHPPEWHHNASPAEMPQGGRGS